MRTRIGWTILLLVCQHISAQTRRPTYRQADTSRLIGWTEDAAPDLPVISLNGSSRSEDAVSVIPSLLGANRDVLLNTAAFHFNAVRFRLRGYDGDWMGTLVNGISMNNPEDGMTPWAYWSGLNDVTKNTQVGAFLQPTETGFGNIGLSTSIDMRAFRQREQTQIGYSFSNRSYTHRLSVSHVRGMNAKGWSFAVDAGIRYASEGYTPGTFVNGVSYYLAADKKTGNNSVLSFCIFGNAAVNGKQSASVKEVTDLTGSVRYNAYWGLQNGKPRNANLRYTHVPVCILTYDKQQNNHESYLFSLAAMIGERSTTAFDWYNAPDPRPDYYRNLPSYYTDSSLHTELLRSYADDPGLLQINWDKLYAVNRNSYETVYDVDGVAGKQISGLRSHYILEERVVSVQRVDAGLRYQSMPFGNLSFSAGASAGWQRLHYYKRIDDLLGGEYYMDWNQFAEGEPAVMQNDLDHPNRVLKQGDRYGYHYLMMHGNVSGWMQAVLKQKKWDGFFAVKLGYTTWFRDGLARTGLFPDQSLGRSVVYEFAEYAAKAGITYKFNGRHYLAVQMLAQNKAPSADNVFISPTTRNTAQETIDMQEVVSTEISYHLQSPRWKLRASAYSTWFRNGMNILSFYHDVYRSFVNYALTGIDKWHRGIELSAEWKLSPRYALSGVASIGNYIYTSRQNLVVTSDNDAYVLERGVVYMKNYRVGGTPQEAYAAGLSYQTENGLYANLSANYFRKHWIEINPFRRTYSAVSLLQPGTRDWERVLDQWQLPDQFTVDISGGKSFRLNSRTAKLRTLSVYAGINNLLNKQNLISGGYEQLRFDVNHIDRFPAKFFYAMGLNFSVNISLKF